MRVVFAHVPAADIFNANDPGLLWNVAKEYKDSWWDKKYDELRDLLRDVFIEEFDALTEHYSRLRDSIERDGIQNPIIITAGKPIWREPWMVPDSKYICESCGGSRLMIAKELGIEIPCIINDRIGIDGEPINSISEVLSKFSDKSYSVTYGPPVRVSPKRFSHMPKSYTFQEQQRCRRLIKEKQIALWKKWSAENTRKHGQ